MSLIYVLIGLVALFLGGEALVRGASRLALSLGMSPLLVGLTVVAFGTSAPEMVVSVDAVFAGTPEIALGNIIGSNITNVLLILGATSLVFPLVVHRQLIRIEIPLMIGASLLFWGLSWNGQITRIEGVVLFGSMLGYLGLCIGLARRQSDLSATEIPSELNDAVTSYVSKRFRQQFLWIGFGGALLSIGGHFLVLGAVQLAEMWGIDQLIIGLTIVAIGSSMPELVTSLVAGLRKQGDIAVGNVLGSNIANLLLVGGVAGMLSPNSIEVESLAITRDLPLMIVVAVLCLPICWSDFRIRRWEGGLLVGGFLMYVGVLLVRLD